LSTDLEAANGARLGLGMSASSSVSEHYPDGCSDGCSGKQTKHGSATDWGRACCQHKAGNSHTQSPENYANVHGVLQWRCAAPVAIGCRCTAPEGNLSIG